MERLALDRFASPWLRHQHLARYRWAARSAAGARVLDAACGTGYGSRILREGGATRVVSVDLSKEAFQEAARGGEDSLLAIRADATRLPLRSGSFDLYVSFETLEHVEDDEGLVGEARRLVGSRGRFLCSTPNRELLSPGNSLADRPANPYHVREYSIPELERLLKRHFAEVALFGQTWFSEKHQRRLALAGAWSNHLAVRVHQLRNIAGLPLARARRHEPEPLGRSGVPEVVIALCGN